MAVLGRRRRVLMTASMCGGGGVILPSLRKTMRTCGGGRGDTQPSVTLTRACGAWHEYLAKAGGG